MTLEGIYSTMYNPLHPSCKAIESSSSSDGRYTSFSNTSKYYILVASISHCIPLIIVIYCNHVMNVPSRSNKKIPLISHQYSIDSHDMTPWISSLKPHLLSLRTAGRLWSIFKDSQDASSSPSQRSSSRAPVTSNCRPSNATGLNTGGYLW